MHQMIKPPKKAVVIGGGIIGICCALHLQRDGFHVTIVDPSAASDTTVKWSCGQIAISEVIPLSRPDVLKNVPGWLLNPDSPLALRPSALVRLFPWLLRFASYAHRSKIEEIASAMAILTKHAHSDYADLLEQPPSQSLIGSRPVIEVFDSFNGIANQRPYLEIRKQLGFEVEPLDAADISDLEPHLAGKFKCGLLFPDWKLVNCTEGFLQALDKRFIRNGGIRIREKAVRIDEDYDRSTGITLANGRRLPAEHVIVTAGTKSREFFHQLGIGVPLAAVAGYQALLPQPGIEINHSVIYADGGFCFSPLSRGLQIGGTIEFANHGAKPNFSRAEMILKKAKHILPSLNTTDVQYGVGYRPFIPDSMPVIDRSPRFRNVYMAFGHGQLGLTAGASTGRLIAEMIGCRLSEDLTPFNANRFDSIGGLQ
ncbi:FAD-binding oxidoreductase [Pseudomonas sp. MOB-449]|nr:FAD-binding oxidoreductase [Pseudomonas sp. MOB-449]